MPSALLKEMPYHQHRQPVHDLPSFYHTHCRPYTRFVVGLDDVILRVSYHIISFIFIPWIHTGLQNPCGYGNIHICLRSQYKSVQQF